MSGSGDIVVAIIGAAGIVVAALLGYWGVKATIRASREASNATTHEQESNLALDAWRELVDPLRGELRTVRNELDTERRQRQSETNETRRRINAQAQQIEQLRREVRTWKRLAKTIARWATSLRDEVLRLGGTVPATPEELLTLQALEDAETD